MFSPKEPVVRNLLYDFNTCMAEDLENELAMALAGMKQNISPFTSNTFKPLKRRTSSFE